jgi:hypothetical protein
MGQHFPLGRQGVGSGGVILVNRDRKVVHESSLGGAYSVYPVLPRKSFQSYHRNVYRQTH